MAVFHIGAYLRHIALQPFNVVLHRDVATVSTGRDDEQGYPLQ